MGIHAGRSRRWDVLPGTSILRLTPPSSPFYFVTLKTYQVIPGHRAEDPLPYPFAWRPELGFQQYHVVRKSRLGGVEYLRTAKGNTRRFLSEQAALAAAKDTGEPWTARC